MAAGEEDAPPAARLVHRVAGRFRIRIDTARDDAGFLEAVREALEQVPGVRFVRVSAPPASVVVLHDPRDAAAPERVFKVLRSDPTVAHPTVARYGRPRTPRAAAAEFERSDSEAAELSSGTLGSQARRSGCAAEAGSI